MTRNEFRFRVLAEMEALKTKKDTIEYIQCMSEEKDLYAVMFKSDGVLTETDIRFYGESFQVNVGNYLSATRWYDEVVAVTFSASIGEYFLTISLTGGTRIILRF